MPRTYKLFTPKLTKYRYAVTPCGVVGYNQLIVPGFSDVVKLDKDRRVRPEPLHLHPTPRGTQYRTISHYGLQERFENSSVYCDGASHQVLLHSENRFAAKGSVPSVPYIDWPLALRSRIKAQAVSFAETIGEYKEAIGYVSGGANILRRAFNEAVWLWRNRRMRRRIWRRYRRRFGQRNRLKFIDVVGLDLAIKFGLIPNVELLMAVLEQLALNRLSKFRVQVTVSQDVSTQTPGIYGGYSTYRIKESKRAIVYVRFKEDAPDFTAGNALEAIWAGTTLSFMIDWFWNLGRSLSALDAMLYVDSVTGTVTTRRKTWIDDARPGYNFILVKPAKYRQTAIWRDVITAVPLPRLPEFKLPDFDLGKLTSAVEILASLRSRR